MEKLPKELKGKLPSIEEIEAELSLDVKNEPKIKQKRKKT